MNGTEEYLEREWLRLFQNQQKIQDVQPTTKYIFIKFLTMKDKKKIPFKAARDINKETKLNYIFRDTYIGGITFLKASNYLKI